MKWTPRPVLKLVLLDLVSGKFKPLSDKDSFQKTQKQVVFLRSREENRTFPISWMQVIMNV